ncbi:MAG: alginate lyase family protein [Chitinophagaceae bacterium]
MDSLKKYACCLVLLAGMALQTSAQLPSLFLENAATADAIKKNPSEAAKDNIRQLARQADKLLGKQFGSVMDKNFPTPSGNQHNYMSMAKYYWPDPSKPDGKPYIKKDGQKNPANDLVSDDKNFDDLIAAVHMLSWAWYFTNDEKYAGKATELIHFWFLDPETMMLPNLNNAQVRTGIDTGVSTGIIDAHNLPQVADGIGLLRSSKSWKPADEKGMQQWFAAYLNWLLTSKNGKKERVAKNNHGSFYDLQVLTIGLFVNDKKVVDDMLKELPARMTWQIEPDGKQPLELERTLALSYSTFNLEAWSLLATAAATRGTDLWHYQTDDGSSLRKAIDYLMPYATGEKTWDYQQIGAYKAQDFYRILLMAAAQFKAPEYKAKAAKIKEENKNVLVKILYE